MGLAGRKRMKENFSIKEMTKRSCPALRGGIIGKKILTLSDLQNTGGASIACNRIANALRSNDQHVYRFHLMELIRKVTNFYFWEKNLRFYPDYWIQHLPPINRSFSGKRIT